MRKSALGTTVRNPNKLPDRSGLTYGGRIPQRKDAKMDITMPALSPEMEEGMVARWLVAVGDEVSPGAVLAEIETDKATVELEAEAAGIVETLLVREGEPGVPVGAAIARLRALG